jgi:hypothetical protein
MDTNEIILYKSDTLSSHIEVRIEDETVWLTQLQMADLFQTTRNNVTLHIGNIFKEAELEATSVSKDFLLTAKDGKKYKTKLYNLDVIISVGYRVKSKTGTQFRIWATNTLKSYLLKGYAIQQKIDTIEKKLFEQDKKIEFLLNTTLPPNQGIFYDGQIFDAYELVARIIKSARKSIILVDNYCDESVLLLLSKRAPNVKATIYTHKIEAALQLDLEKHNQQYHPIAIQGFKKAHDRFLIIDNEELYHIGASLKDLGKKWFAFSKLQLPIAPFLEQLK